MHKRLILAVAVLLPLITYAVPAWQGPIKVTTADGTELTVYQHGDEYFHYFTDDSGQWYERDTSERFVKCPFLTGQQIEQRRIASPKHQALQRRIGRLNLAPSGLVILVNFKDLAFLEKDSLAAFQDMHNGDNYNHRGATGSARKYFYDQSMGTYNPHFEVVGPVTLSKKYSYYGNNTRTGEDAHPEEMVTEACDLVKKQYPQIDFADYDHDHDGFVDFVFVVYAGHNEAMGADSNTIWPHNYYIYSGAGITHEIDGVKLDNYACSSELQNATGTTRAGIGTFCHEFSHVLGLPDLYITRGSSNHKTLGTWDILDAGPYNNASRTPPAYSAYERFFMGWLKPRLLNVRDNIELADIQDNDAVLITEDGTHNLNGISPYPADFYLLENKQQTEWNAYIPGEGLMITHINYNSSTWNSNSVNNDEKNMGVDIIEADGKKPTADDYSQDRTCGYHGKQGDLFPFGEKNYFRKLKKYPVEKIKSENGKVTFKFMGGLKDLNQFVLPEDGSETIVGIYTINGIDTGLKDLNLLTMPGQYVVYKSKNGQLIPSSKIVIVDK